VKIIFKNNSKTINGDNIHLLKSFIKFLQEELPLKKDVKINFIEQKNGKMTTGVRRWDEIEVLSGGRLLIDIMRTIAHEWTHEFQYQKLKLDDTKKHQDIGGPVENMANALAGIMIKKFNKENPEHEKTVYKKNQEHQK
jgi:hypothetical protein